MLLCFPNKILGKDRLNMTNEQELIGLKEELDNYLAERNYRKIKAIMEEIPEADAAEYLEGISIDKAMPIFRSLSKERCIEVFSYFEPETQEIFINSITDEEISNIIEELSVDDAVDMLEEMPATIVKKVLKNASANTRKLINQFLNYPEDSVGSIMTAEFTDLKGTMTVGEAIKYIRSISDNRETIYTCYIISPSRQLEGVIELCDILACENDDTLISDIMETSIVKAVTTDDKETVAGMFSKYDITTLPVVDNENRLVGIVTVDDIVDVIEEEATKDIEQMAAMQPLETPYLKTSVFTIVKKRIIWLLILMIAGTITGSILGKFEAAISAIPLLVTFMPMIFDTGGNSGSQSSTTVIRGLTTGELECSDIWKILWKEIRVSVIVGLSFGALNFLRILLITKDPDKIIIALVVSLAMLLTIVIAKSLGAVLPIAAKKLRLDPAVMAAPLITTTVDVCAMLVYFGLALKFLSFRL
jgi:magnesium transporter